MRLFKKYWCSCAGLATTAILAAPTPVYAQDPIEEVPRLLFQEDPDAGNYAPDDPPPQFVRRVELPDEQTWQPGDSSAIKRISVDDAQWIQVHFDPSTKLGEDGVILVRSEQDDLTKR